MAGEGRLYKVLIFTEGKFKDLADEELELCEALEIVRQFNRLMAGRPHWAALTEQGIVVGGGKGARGQGSGAGDQGIRGDALPEYRARENTRPKAVSH